MAAARADAQELPAAARRAAAMAAGGGAR